MCEPGATALLNTRGPRHLPITLSVKKRQSSGTSARHAASPGKRWWVFLGYEVQSTNPDLFDGEFRQPAIEFHRHTFERHKCDTSPIARQTHNSQGESRWAIRANMARKLRLIASHRCSLQVYKLQCTSLHPNCPQCSACIWEGIDHKQRESTQLLTVRCASRASLLSSLVPPPRSLP